ncbi:MAG: thioesterase family protein [Proteobacteria bacterium]|nr:thioesterase family protein [Pseudomonadota bacterium]
MTTFSALLDQTTRENGAWVSQVTDDWRQGRTLYGGLSAALCLNAALEAFADLPPLRSAQFAFVGPAAGAVSAAPAILRQGKSATSVSVDLSGEGGLATRALLTFGAARPSAYARASLPAPVAATAPDASGPFFRNEGRPTFSQHFDVRNAGGARPVTAAEDPDVLVWLRHHDLAARTTLTGLLALADATPPAAMSAFTAPAPISTMTWMVDVVGDCAQVGPDGWLLMSSRAETIADGYSAQGMTLWTQDGRPLVAARQMVAVFG